MASNSNLNGFHTIVLGALDPEMEAVRKLALESKLNILWASYKGMPVKYNTMYKADWPFPQKGQLWVECSPFGGKEKIQFADHHQPGDPGFEKPPEKFWEASSLGQVWKILYGNREAPAQMKIIAAADHCPKAAYSGKCPGVKSKDVIEFSTEQISLRLRIEIWEAEREISDWIKKFDNSQLENFDGNYLFRYIEQVISEDNWLLLREAGLRHGIAVLALIQMDSEIWVRVAGHATKDLINSVVACQIGIPMKNTYGNPSRGYAGGMVSSKSSFKLAA